MKDIFKDKVFDNWLYGGVHDLDEDIGHLIYDFYKLGIIETRWSCSGHIGTKLLDGGYSIRPKTHFVYIPGNLFFNLKGDSKRAHEFVSSLRKEVAKSQFAQLSFRDNMHKIILEMNDILCPIDNSANFYGVDEIIKIINNCGAVYGEVKIEDAQKRYAEFKLFWENLRGVVKIFRQ